MIYNIFKPKNTFLSVATEIEEGIKNESIYLNDKELIDAGYEIHDFTSHRETPLLLVMSIAAALSIAEIMLFFEDIKHSYFRLMNCFVLVVLLIDRLQPTNKRFITRRSTGSPKKRASR